MFAYQGSKRKELPQIREHEPTKFKTFVDVFGGGGSVFLDYLNRPGIKCVYNDNNKTLADTFKIVAEGKESAERLMKEIESYDIKTSEDLNAVRKEFERNPTPALYFAILINSMRGIFSAGCVPMRKTKDGQCIRERRSIPKFNEYCASFEGRNFEITNEDYKTVLAKYKDDPDAFLYMDPPYTTKHVSNLPYEKGHGQLTKVDLDYVGFINEFMKECKCKVMIHVDFSARNYVFFNDRMRTMYPISYGARRPRPGAIKIDVPYHMIATNYKNRTPKKQAQASTASKP